VEEMFAIVILQTYPCNNDSISDTQKLYQKNIFGDLTLTKQAHLTVITPSERNHFKKWKCCTFHY